MSKRGSAGAVLAAAALIILAGCGLAGCGGVPTHTAPEVPGQTAGSTATGGSSPASGTAPAHGTRPSRQQGTASVGGTRQKAAAKSFVKANSLPFPVAVGNTWVYRTTVDGATGRTTNRIVSAGPVPAGYRVTMASTTEVAGAAATVQPVYLFYPDGTIGYPVPSINGVSVPVGRVRWPDAAGLASGRAYHSVLRVPVSQTGRQENANVTVQGGGTTSVRVPAGTYRASIVVTTIAAAKMGTVQVTTWIAQGVGPVKTGVLIQAAGAELTSTSELLSFTKARAAGLGS